MAVAIRALVLPLLALLLGVLALGASALHYDESRQVQRDGVIARVEAVDNAKWVKRSSGKVTYRADIRFTGPDGTVVTTKAPISDSALERYKAGTALQLRYLPDQPQVIRLVGEEDEGSSGLLVILGAAALAYASFELIRALRK
jgi:hypothetical protein